MLLQTSAVSYNIPIEEVRWLCLYINPPREWTIIYFLCGEEVNLAIFQGKNFFQGQVLRQFFLICSTFFRHLFSCRIFFGNYPMLVPPSSYNGPSLTSQMSFQKHKPSNWRELMYFVVDPQIRQPKNLNYFYISY